MKRSDRKVLIALLILLGIALTIVIVNRRDRPNQLTGRSTKDLNVQISCYDNQDEPYVAYFCDETLLVQSQMIQTKFKSATKVDKVRLTVTDSNGSKTHYLPREGITTRMVKSGEYCVYWNLKNLPKQGSILITITMGEDQESFQTNYMSGIPDLISFFIEQSDTFNLEMRMENLEVGTKGDTIEKDGLKYTELTGLTYSSLEDMDDAVSGLFSTKYIEEYHDFFDDYYFFFNHNMYQREATGIQEVSLIRTADIQSMGYEKVHGNKCTVRCNISEGYYLLDFVKQDQDWRLEQFQYVKE